MGPARRYAANHRLSIRLSWPLSTIYGRAQASLLRAELLEDISHALGIPTSALAMISVKESPAVATAAFQVLMVVERPPAALCEELLEVIVAAAESGGGAAIIGAPAAHPLPL